ncbi:hypothetical protein Scep_025249 [Stephania cephalantha]|uniref:Uncharacterized protein n=1 Tax=Stephania cephalantha TaxID=152367 RepID=A0AAP0HSB3_9MAGN
MNSMLFSSFDAVLGEYFGQKMMNSTFNLGNKQERNVNDGAKAAKAAAAPPVKERVPAKKEAAPRFAVELDGLHCYETIVSH